MREHAQTFNEFISRHNLARAEGVLLRYLTDAWHALTRSAPPAAWEALADVTDWLGETIRQVDSSLMEEWERLAAVEAVDDAARPG
jgi:hypothetical protein